MKTQAFLDKHHNRMLAFLEGASPRLQGMPELRMFIDEVQRDFEQVNEPSPAHRSYLAGEEVFFVALDNLQMLADVVVVSHPPDPYIRMIIDRLRGAAGPLKARQDPPAGECVIWQGWVEEEDDEEFDAEMEALLGKGWNEQGME